MLIDAHAHLKDPDSRIADLRAMGFTASIQGGVGPEDWDRQLEAAGRFPDFFKPVLGLHPWWVIEHSERECREALDHLEGLLAGGGVVGLGELGLDFFRDSSSTSGGLQQAVLREQLERFARAPAWGGLPLVLHVVHAHEVALGILKEHYRAGGAAPLRGIVHAFSGSYEIAQEYLKLGLKLSIGPGLAQPGRFKQLKAALPRLAPTDWVLESDGDGPELLQAARAAAGLTGRDLSEVLETSSKTLQTLFF